MTMQGETVQLPDAEPLADTAAAPAPVSFIRAFARQRAPMVGLMVLIAIVAVAIVAPWIAKDGTTQDVRATFVSPGRDHLLGTDQFGRDIFKMLILGARTTIVAVLYALSISFACGGVTGLIAGYARGWIDVILSRVFDAMMALPGLLAVIAIVTALGPSLRNAMVAAGLLLAPTVFRLVRAEVQSVREMQFVDAARVMGFSQPRIIVKHVLSNIWPLLITQATLMVGFVVLVEAGLSFLGLGIQPPNASWGLMLSDAQDTFRTEAWPVIPPGLAIAVTVLAANLVGDGLNDALRRRQKPILPSRRRTRSRIPSANESAAGLAGSSESPVAPADPECLLQVRNLTVSVRSNVVGETEMTLVSGVDLDLRAGETMGLIGESGSGKSLTALSIMGLLREPVFRSAGSIRFAGRELTALPERQMAALRGGDIAMIFQEPQASLNPALTVGAQISEAIRIHRGGSRREARERAVELLDLVGILNPRSRADDYPHQLSGGMAQRVMIAMALSCDPKLLIADEATTALDVTVQAGILDLLHDLRDQFSMSMLLVTHNLGVVADAADSLSVMYAGQIVETGPVRDVLLHPTHPYTESLLRSMPEDAPRTGPLHVIPGTVPPPWAWQAGCRFADRCDYAQDRCREPHVPLTNHGSSATRCVRVDDLQLMGAGDESAIR